MAYRRFPFLLINPSVWCNNRSIYPISNLDGAPTFAFRGKPVTFSPEISMFWIPILILRLCAPLHTLGQFLGSGYRFQGPVCGIVELNFVSL